MSITFRHWFLFLAACAMAGLAASALTARPGLAQDQARNELRMDVDFTVLPKVLPDGSEAPASPAVPPEEPLTPEPDLPDAADAQTPPPADQPAAQTAAPADTAPESAPMEQAEIPAVSPVKGTGLDERLRVLVDFDLWRRMAARYAFHHIPEHTGDYFIHRQIDGQMTGLVRKDPLAFQYANVLIQRKAVPPELARLHGDELSATRQKTYADFLTARAEQFKAQGNERRRNAALALAKRIGTR